MEEDASIDSKSVRVWLVKTNEELSDDMLTVLHLCEQYRSNGIRAEWITRDDCINKKRISKKDVFVLEAFSGQVFEKLSTTEAIIVGPKCLSCCLNDGEEIPRGATFTIAMRDLVITISGFTPKDKEKLKKYILWMGGRYDNKLTEETTHLVSKTVFSDKYVKAGSLNFPIMKAEWVEAVWKESLKINISAKNSQFDKYRLPIFHGVWATTTGIKRRSERNKIIELINKNGGTYLPDFESEKINILILKNDDIGTEKHKCAMELKITCVSPSWIHKSVESGYALDHKNFLIEPLNKNAPSTSSPNKTSQLPDMSINVSCIQNVKNTNFAEETYLTNSSDSTCVPFSSQKNHNLRKFQTIQANNEFAQLIDNIEIKNAKQAGLFLDGCSIFVYGASPARRDKLQRIVSLAGGVRFDNPDESVTHTICCDPIVRLTADQLLAMPDAKHVSVHWIIECIKKHKAVDETHYIVLNCDNNFRVSNVKSKETLPSPMSKMNMQLLLNPIRPPVPLFKMNSMDDNDKDDEIVQQYLSQPYNAEDVIPINDNNHSNDDENGTLKKTCTVNEDLTMNKPNDSDSEDPEIVDEEDEEYEEVFKELTFELRDIEEEEAEIFTTKIIAAGGNVVKSSRRKSKHYIVVPTCYDNGPINTNAEIITPSWLDDCLNTLTLVPIDYYHRPLEKFPKSNPLSNLTISISVYMGSERQFLSDIASFLGATVKPVLHKRISTHLICAEPSGAKYEGAINWGIIVVTNKWLLDCLAAEKHLWEEPYLVGASKAPKKNESNEENDESKSKDGSNKSAFSSKNNNTNLTEDKIKDITLSNVCNKSTTNEIENFEPKDLAIENKLLSQIDKKSSNCSPLRKSITRSSLGNAEMSPASRYIAMNRQGMITNSQDTPKKSEEVVKAISHPNDTMSTPPLENALSTPNIALFSTTSKRRINAVKRGEIPSEPPHTPRNPFDMNISTPDSHFGKSLRPGSSKMSPESRKRLKKFCEELPSPCPSKQPKQDTPMSELKNKFFMKHLENTPSRKHALEKNNSSDNKIDDRPAKQLKLSDEPNFSNNVKLQDDLRLLDTMLTGGEGSNTVSTPRSVNQVRSSLGLNTLSNAMYSMENVNVNSTAKAGCVESQIDTVGWDDMTESAKIHVVPKVYRFMLAQNIRNSIEIKCIIERLGGSVLEGTENVLNATHILYASLSRSEKLLTCLAARKWVLHPDYIIESQKAGRFIDEEFYEWGNPKTKIPSSVSNEFLQLANSIYRLRMVPPKTPLPFHSFKIILCMEEKRKPSISRIIKAGGGEILDTRPPFKGNIIATHCFLETSNYPISTKDLKFLAARNIPVCPPIFLSTYLISDPLPSPMDHLCPEYKTLRDTKK